MAITKMGNVRLTWVGISGGILDERQFVLEFICKCAGEGEGREGRECIVSEFTERGNVRWKCAIWTPLK